MMIRFFSYVSALIFAALPVSADVVRAADDGFQIHLERSSELPSNLQYARMATLSDWWLKLFQSTKRMVFFKC